MAASWLPRQHGAWAMVLAPLVAGGIVRATSPAGLPVWFWSLALTWLAGYVTFHGFSRWAKAHPKRRPALVRPLVVAGGVTAVSGVLTLLLGGFGLLAFAPLFVVPVGLAVVEALRGRERSVLSGCAAVVAASLVLPVVVLGGAGPGWSPADTGRLWAAWALLAGYFCGTVLHVKALIRERSQSAGRRRTVVGHAALLGLAGALVITGWIPAPWVVFFALTLLRTALMTGGRAHPPLTIGLVEVGFTLAAIGLTVASV